MRRSTLLLLMILLTALPVTIHAQTETAADEDLLSFTFDELERTFVLHVPETISEPAPLVIALHGRFGTGHHMQRLSRFDEVADAEGFIVAYPDGINNEWNYVADIPGYPEAQDDLAFLNALVEHIATLAPVDLTRVYLTGFSNGGFMAQRVACEDPSHFAAFASVAATAFGGMTEVCLPIETVQSPMLLMHGTMDNNILWTGNGVQRNGRVIYSTYPVVDSFAYWSEFNDCIPDAEPRDFPRATEDSYVRALTLDCPEGTGVELYVVVGGGHNWPGQTLTEPAEVFGLINQDINASEEIWSFFEQFSREQAE